MPTPEPITPEQFQAVLAIMALPDSTRETLMGAISTPDLIRYRGALGELYRLISLPGTQHTLATCFVAMSATERRELLGNLTPGQRVQLLESLDKLDQQQEVLEVGKLLAETETTLLESHLED